MDERAKTGLSPATAGYGIAAVMAILFNTLLAWVKDSTPALQNAMKVAFGHHWITHGVVVVLVFFVLGWILSQSAIAQRIGALGLNTALVGAVLLGGLGLVGWFFFV